MKEIFMIGIKGAGMSALANVLYDLGYKISGSDYSDYFYTEKSLVNKGIQIYNFSIDNIKENQIIIKGNAFKNDEYKKALNLNLEIYGYNEFIEKKIVKNLIAISGTHGKTTTTKMISTILKEEYSICSIIGDGTGYAKKNYMYTILEACEYKDHFLIHFPKTAIITNIEFDHPDYFNDLTSTYKSFQKFASQSEKLIINGRYNIDHTNKITFGFEDEDDVYCKIIEKDSKGYKIEIKYLEIIHEYQLPFYGDYMVLNFLATFSFCKSIGISDKKIQKEIDNYKLPDRRFQETEINGQIIIDDYAHHPSEIKSLFDGVKQKYNKKIVVIFQPHTYTRTKSLLNEFSDVLNLADVVFIDKIFSSVRENIDETLFLKLLKKTNGAKKYSLIDLNVYIGNLDYLLIFMGAGTINEEIEKLRENI